VTLLPQGFMVPMPVIATRRLWMEAIKVTFEKTPPQWPVKWSCGGRVDSSVRSGLLVVLDIGDHVADGLDFFLLVFWDWDAKVFFDGHHDCDQVQTVGAKVVNEVLALRDGFFWLRQRLSYQRDYFASGVSHGLSSKLKITNTSLAYCQQFGNRL
jgi:hypothetical protein